ncbi:Alpha/Beta hydrolase protein [Cokeromyces recurvatus]|uniref:Alpha/Beta hydrolase protein n=1 Tax=Cokeromyces recurvatus TaxID=90255 RepID=UPI0022200DB1|nr:Alpha/Beta hydrolase protein [Cokeromyces recurvatus]KAI7899403.1 Alpha/Beta hydrolase protein [Cokeromyces recurvatus]
MHNSTVINNSESWDIYRIDPTEDLFTEEVIKNEINNDPIPKESDFNGLYDTLLTKEMTPSSTDTSMSSSEENLFIDDLKLPKRITINKKRIKRIKRSTNQRIIMFVHSLLSTMLSLSVLLVFVIIAIYKTSKTLLFDTFIYKNLRPHEDLLEVPDELLTQDETYYADRWGYTSEMHQVVTKDGYVLNMYRIYKKTLNLKRPVMIGHGLFQCSGAFVLNEERSLAFTLSDEGYDVWVGNNRSITGYDHISLSHKDPEYWNWGLKELGVYDFCAMIEYIKEYTGFSKVAYIGHSQGNAQAFIALKLCPDIKDSLSCFVALAPAVFSGDLVKKFPLCLLINLSDWIYTLMFGKTSFLPIMKLVQTMIEPRIFSFLAYSMFSYLFNWWDNHWLRRRKVKYFQFTPRPVSARLISDWLAGWGRKGTLLYVADKEQEDDDTKKDTTKKVPLIVFYGTSDYLVNGERFVRTFPGYENHGLGEQSPPVNDSRPLFSMLNLVQVERLVGYEHMDTIWGHDNHKTTYPIILKNLKNIKEWN